MKSITVKRTINTGNYENIVVEATFERELGLSLDQFLELSRMQFVEAIKRFHK